MFLCNDCHDVDRHIEMFRSLGACEFCHKLASCIDCHVHECHPPRPPKEYPMGKRGFASMDPDVQRQIAKKGGRAAHEAGTAHQWTGGKKGTAAKAGKLGGAATHRNRKKTLSAT